MTRHDATCPDRSRLQHLLEGRLTAADHSTLARHLDTCEGCQRALEVLEAEARRPWPVDRPEENGPALRRVIEELQDDRPVGATETTLPPAPTDWTPDLDFLGPPTGPDQIGTLGPYQVIGVIGRGGMGVVLKAFDPTLHRVVAIKILHPGLATSGTARMRFLREARAAAAISHDHVITIHAVDECNGIPYLVMRFIAGLSLQERIDRSGPLELREILRIGRQIASGLAAAHAQGLVHRDIKPANILLENGVERVKITDFGLARAADDASLTGSGVLAGTPQYMAPEQARGEPIDHRADLFSLGGVLYAMSTGRPPFRGSTTMGILRRVSDEEPPPIRDLNPDIPDWLVAIIERLHAKDPADRFPSAAAVAELLGQHLISLQRPTQPPTPARRWAIRKPAALDELPSGGPSQRRAGWSVAGLIVLAVLALVLVRAGMRDGLNVSIRTPRLVDQDIESSDRIVEAAKSPSAQGVILCQVSGAFWTLAFSPDGTTLAAGNHDGTMRLWNRQGTHWSEGVVLKGHSADVRSVAFSPDGTTLASGSFDATAQLWDVATGRRLAMLKGHRDTVNGVAFSPDGTTLASASLDGTVTLWDVSSGQKVRTIRDRDDWVLSVAFSPDGTTLATGGRTSPRPEPSLVQLWDLATGRKRATLEGHGDWVESVAFSPDGTILASGSHDEMVRLWDASSGELRQVLRQGCTVESLTFSPDGRLLAVGSEQGIVRLWDHENSLMLATLPASTEPVYALAFTIDGQTLVTGSHDGTVRLWNVEALVREAEATLAETPGGPFVLLADRGDDADRRFGSLEAAVANAPNDGTIEIHGNGPFRLPAGGIHLTSPLTIRAGSGFVPVLQQDAKSKPGEARSKFLFHVLEPTTLEGLVLDRAGPHEVAEERSVILAQGVPLRIANCRIRPQWPQNFAIWADRSPDIELRNTIIDGVCGDVIVPNQCQAGDRIALVNCLVSPRVERNVIAFPIQPSPVEFLRIELLGNTFGSSLVALRPEDRIERLEIRAEHNIIVHDVILTLWGQPRESGEEALKDRFRWKGHRNMLPVDLPLVCFDDQPLDRWRTLSEWNRLWGTTDGGAILGPPRFEHLTSIRQLAHAEDPTEWRLAPDSPGYRAGDDGQDLGANVDLVGPGEAYERWKATPEYPQWASAPPRPAEPAPATPDQGAAGGPM